MGDQQMAAQDRSRLVAEVQAYRTNVEQLTAQVDELNRGAGENEAQQAQLSMMTKEMAQQLEETKRDLRHKERDLQVTQQKLAASQQRVASISRDKTEAVRQQQDQQDKTTASMYGDELPAGFKSSKKGKQK